MKNMYGVMVNYGQSDTAYKVLYFSADNFQVKNYCQIFDCLVNTF